FETALNTYFKWIQYSNFSWFKEGTVMYGVEVGKEIINKLGGWTADSWLMVDLAADIPGKIDLRWMSRFGLFLWMDKKLADLGIKFEDYTAWVDLTKNLMENTASGNITVSLKWFSKLLQSTGLHPAWVPLVTVAENIMAISDEMTLLRAGWLNLFKEGLLSYKKVDSALGGLLTISYEVGYWDPTVKEWKSKWLNLPVLWLPHERKLLEFRMLMDRFLDLYREYYNTLRRFVSRNIITMDDMKKRLQDFLVLAVHGRDGRGGFYKDIVTNITGISDERALEPFLPTLDEKYLDVWEPIIRDLYEEEKVERARIYMRYIVSRLIERYAQGFITDSERELYIQIFQKYVRMTDTEITMIKDISDLISSFYSRQLKFDALINRYKRFRITREELKASLADIGIRADFLDDIIEKYVKSYVPTLSQLATLAETVPEVLTEKLGDKPYYKFLLEFYDLNDVEKRLWSLYIERKQILNEVSLFRSRIIDLISFGMSESAVLTLLGFSKVEELVEWSISVKEWNLLVLAGKVERYKDVWSYYSLSPSKLVQHVELMPENISKILSDLESYSLSTETIKYWETYLWRKKLSNDISLIRSRLITLIDLGVDITNIDFEKIMKAASDIWGKIGGALSKYGFTEKEFQVWYLAAFLEGKKVEVPSPSFLGTIAEYVVLGDELLEESLSFHKVKRNWWPVLKDYIRTRPLRDDLNRLLNRIYDGWVKDIPLGEYGDKAVALLKRYGWTDEEFRILKLTAQIESIIKGYEENWPSPLTLATISEVVPEVRALIDSVFEKKKVPPELRKYLKKYVQLKPLQDEIRNLINEVIYGYGYGTLEDEHMYVILNFLRQLGFEEDEVKLVYTRAVLYRLRIQRKKLPSTELQRLANEALAALFGTLPPATQTTTQTTTTTAAATPATTTTTTTTTTAPTKPSFVW
ncbi:MAG: hypothetical protein B7O98_09455, partial [Zestosphaera tikiterensis]